MAVQKAHRSLGQLLIESGTARPDQIDRALEQQRRGNHQELLGDLLVDAQVCTEEKIVESLAESHRIPYAEISPQVADPRVISMLPMEYLNKHQALPLFLVEGLLTVAVSEPSNIFLLEELERLTGHRVQLVAAMMKDIKATLQAYLPHERMFILDGIAGEVEIPEFLVTGPTLLNEDELRRQAAEVPVIRLLNHCIHAALKEGASDIHLEPAESVLRIRFRIDGRLVERLSTPVQIHAALVARIKTMASLEITERHLPQDGGIHVRADNRSVDLKVTTVPGRHGETMVLRIIDKDKAPFTLEKLGFSYDTLKSLRKALALNNGLFLVTGPAGSGKGTTLHAALQEINKPELNLCTIEDPINCALQGVNQFEINEKAGFTFAGALHSVLAQEPDILMVGELRDHETAGLLVQAALTGHLVLSSLHTANAPGAITRLYHLGLEPYLVGATLAAVLAQRLVRKLCQSCREAYAPNANERRQIDKHISGVELLHRPKGCGRCQDTGYVGRVGIFELLIPDEAMLERISQGVPTAELREHAERLGMKTLRADGMEKVKAGITTLDEVFRVTG